MGKKYYIYGIQNKSSGNFLYEYRTETGNGRKAFFINKKSAINAVESGYYGFNEPLKDNYEVVLVSEMHVNRG